MLSNRVARNSSQPADFLVGVLPRASHLDGELEALRFAELAGALAHCLAHQRLKWCVVQRVGTTKGGNGALHIRQGFALQPGGERLYP